LVPALVAATLGWIVGTVYASSRHRVSSSKAPVALMDNRPSWEPALPSEFGYPLSHQGGFQMRFYWVAFQDDYADEYDEVFLYTPEGYFLGVFPNRFYRAAKLEGSAILSDGRVINYAGPCRYGTGICFRELDSLRYPVGRGALRRPLKPFRSIAVDPRLIPIGEPLYVPELDGLYLADGTVHDGCVLADDTGGAIKRREIDFFSTERAQYRRFLAQLNGDTRVTPHIESPRCAYLRGF